MYFLLNMVIFHCYVSLPEGRLMMIPLKTRQADGDLSFNVSRLDLQFILENYWELSGNGTRQTEEQYCSTQIIATSHDLTLNGGLVREISLFQGNPGWWNIIPFGQTVDGSEILLTRWYVEGLLNPKVVSLISEPSSAWSCSFMKLHASKRNLVVFGSTSPVYHLTMIRRIFLGRKHLAFFSKLPSNQNWVWIFWSIQSPKVQLLSYWWFCDLLNLSCSHQSNSAIIRVSTN